MALVLVSWKPQRDNDAWKWIQQCLIQSFNLLADSDLKRWDLAVTPDGFFRLRKYYSSGKQEYFSFHFTRLKDVSYANTAVGGDIVFSTTEDDIIVQTYSDPQGNIDSMSTELKLPVVNIEPSRVDSLKNALLMFKHN